MCTKLGPVSLQVLVGVVEMMIAALGRHSTQLYMVSWLTNLGSSVAVIEHLESNKMSVPVLKFYFFFF